MAQKQRYIRPVDKAYFTELERLLPIRELLAMLYRQATPEDDRLARLADMIKSHPGTRPRLLASLALDCKLSYGDVVAAFVRDQHMSGLARQAVQVPQVLVDIADDSLTREVACEKCNGDGTIPRDPKLVEPGDVSVVMCRPCKGTGKLRKIGDYGSRELLLKTQKLIDQNKGGGVTVNVPPPQPASAPLLADVLAQVRGALAGQQAQLPEAEAVEVQDAGN